MNYTVVCVAVLVAAIAAADIDFFLFTQIYPVSTCKADNDQAPISCRVPTNTSLWTIHGLWPSSTNHSAHFEFCTGEKFNLSKLVSLNDRLNKNWPNLFPDASSYSLWKHEWEKHGTCSVNFSQLSTEERYFNYTLFLHDIYSVYRALESHGVTPNPDLTYTLNEITEALNVAFGQGTTKVYCLRDKKTKEWLLADVRLCLNKKLDITQCPEEETLIKESSYPLPTSHPCPSTNIHYPTPEQNLWSWCLNTPDTAFSLILCTGSMEALHYNIKKRL